MHVGSTHVWYVYLWGVCVCAYVPVGVCVNVGLSGTYMVWVWVWVCACGCGVGCWVRVLLCVVDGVSSCVVCV